MDTVFCSGDEDEIINCRFDGWGRHDCTSTEAAGVICEEYVEKEVKEVVVETKKKNL